MCKACPALDFQKSHQLKQERIIGQKGEIKLFLEVMIRRNFNSWGVRAFHDLIDLLKRHQVHA